MSAEQLELDGAQGQRATWSGAAAVSKRQPLPAPESLKELDEDLKVRLEQFMEMSAEARQMEDSTGSGGQWSDRLAAMG